MDLIRQLGLGFVLEFADKTSKQVASAAKEIRNLKGEISGLGSDFTRQVDAVEKQMERNRKVVSTGIKMMAAGAAIVTPAVVAARAAMRDQDTWIGRVTQSMYQQNLTRAAALKAMEREKLMVEDLAHNEIPLPSDEMELAWIRLQGLLNDTVAATESYRNVMRMAVVTQTDAAAAVEAFNTVWGIAKSAMADLGPAERSLRITEMLTRANRQFGAGVVEIADALRFVSDEAKLANPRLEELFALMTPLVSRGMPGRMAGSAVGGLLSNVLRFDQQVDELRRKLGKPVLSLADFQQKKELQLSLTPELRKLMGINFTDKTGVMRSPIDILADLDTALGLTPDRVSKIDELIKTGQLSESDRMKALGLTVSQQQALVNAFGEKIGNFIGQSQQLRSMEKRFGETGILAEAFGAALENASAQTQLLVNYLDDFVEEVGTSLIPTIIDLSKAIKPWLEDFTEFVRNNPNFVRNVALPATAVGGGLALGGAVLTAGGAAANTYLGFRMWQMQREMAKQAGSAVASAADDAAMASVKSAGGAIDDAIKSVAKTTAAVADDAFFAEWAPAMESAMTASVREAEKGAARTIASMLGRGAVGTARGFGGVGLASLIPTGLEASLSAPSFLDIGMQAFGIQRNRAAISPQLAQIGTAIRPDIAVGKYPTMPTSDLARLGMDLLEELGRLVQAQEQSLDSQQPIVIENQHIYVSGGTTNATELARTLYGITASKTKEAADRAVGAQH